MSEDKGSEEAMRVDTDLVKKLARLLDENDLSEIEVEDNGRRIVVKRKIGAATAVPSRVPTASASTPAPAAPAPDSGEAGAADHPGAVKSPMVGTVFLAGEPGAAPFVTAGARVSEGDTLLIIEAMKVMNPIRAPRPGIARQIVVADGQPVEFGEVLMIID